MANSPKKKSSKTAAKATKSSRPKATAKTSKPAKKAASPARKPAAKKAAESFGGLFLSGDGWVVYGTSRGQLERAKKLVGGEIQ